MIGFGAITFLMPETGFYKVAADGSYNKLTDLIGGGNMPALHLSKALGGSCSTASSRRSPSPRSWPWSRA